MFLLCCEIAFFWFKKQETKFKSPQETISHQEFLHRVHVSKEQLVLLDDLVLDVSRFMDNHPGGKFVLLNCIGRDISKFFYGGYILEPSSGMSGNMHSNLARIVVNSLVVARLEREAE